MPESARDANADLKQFLFDDYKLRVEYINAHFTRMWTRFSFFLLVEGGIFGVLFSYFWDKDKNTWNSTNALLVAIAGALVCVIWLLVGIEDRYLVGAYRRQIKKAAERLKKIHAPHLSNYEPIGHLKDGFDSKHLLEWRWDVISVTRLVVYFPCVVAIS